MESIGIAWTSLRVVDAQASWHQVLRPTPPPQPGESEPSAAVAALGSNPPGPRSAYALLENTGRASDPA